MKPAANGLLLQAEKHLENNNFVSATRLFKESLVIQEKSSLPFIARAHLGLAKAYLALEEWELAKKYLLLAMIDFADVKSDLHCAIVNYYLGFLYMQIDNYEQGIPYLEKAVQYFDKSFNGFYTHNSVYWLALGYFYTCKIAKTLESALDALTYYKSSEAKQISRVIKLTLMIGICLYQNKHFKTAEFYFNQAFYIAQNEQKYKQYSKDAAFYLGSCYYERKDYVSAQQMFFYAKKPRGMLRRSKEEHKVNKERYRSMLANTYMALKNYDHAKKLLKKISPQSTVISLQDIQQQLGFCYLKLHKYTKALANLTAALSLANTEVDQMIIKIGLWLSSYHLKEFKQASLYAKQLLLFYENLESYEEVEKASNILKKWLEDAGDFVIFEPNTCFLLKELKKNERILLVTQRQIFFSDMNKRFYPDDEDKSEKKPRGLFMN